MQFQVPQFIETEDKIIGPFSLRQFAYVGAAGVVSAMIYFTLATWLWVILSIFIFGAAFSLAFVKIEGRPFLNVVLSAFNFYWKPQTYVWQPEHKTVTLAPKREVETDKSSLEDILSTSAAASKRVFPKITPRAAVTPSVKSEPAKPVEKPAQKSQPVAEPISRESVATGSALHKSWEAAQTGAALVDKNSDKQFLERKMAERYQIFQKLSGERNAAKRVDYR